MRRHVDGDERVGSEVGEQLGGRVRALEVGAERLGGGERRRFGEVPEELVELTHDGERTEHLGGDPRRPPPVASGERLLRDLLARAEAVVDGAAGKARRSQPLVNGATEVAAEVRAGVARVLVEREVRRGRERGRHAAERDAARAIGAQTRTFSRRAGERHRSVVLRVSRKTVRIGSR